MFPVDFFFLGGRLAVDLLNTVVVPDGRVRDLLSRRVDVASWGEAAGVVARRDLRNAAREPAGLRAFREALRRGLVAWAAAGTPPARLIALLNHQDRKSTRLNSSHLVISYAVFCLKKKKKKI